MSIKDQQESWIAEKIKDFEANPEECLHDLLSRVHDIASQYLDSQRSHATLGALQSAVVCTGLFLNQIDKEK